MELKTCKFILKTIVDGKHMKQCIAWPDVKREQVVCATLRKSEVEIGFL